MDPLTLNLVYTCSDRCPVGEELSEPETCLAIVDCDPNPCLNGGTCTEGVPTGFNCTCAPTYYGTLCEATIGGQGASLGITPLGIILMIICILLIISKSLEYRPWDCLTKRCNCIQITNEKHSLFVFIQHWSRSNRMLIFNKFCLY